MQSWFIEFLPKILSGSLSEEYSYIFIWKFIILNKITKIKPKSF